MRVFRLTVLAAAAALLCSYTASMAMDDAFKTYEKKGVFEEILLDIQDAIIDKGLVIDYTGHVGQMLERTSRAVGMESNYTAATYLTFCSSKLTHAATAADPANIALCPYTMFLYELKSKPGTIVVGYRRPVGATSDKSKAALADIEALLDGIAKDVTD